MRTVRLASLLAVGVLVATLASASAMAAGRVGARARAPRPTTRCPPRARAARGAFAITALTSPREAADDNGASFGLTDDHLASFGAARDAALSRAAAAADAASERRDRAPGVDGGANGDRGFEGPSSVYLVGCGPGDPELLTLKAFRLLATAELVLYDRLVSADILRCASPSATLVYVGKERDLHSRTQHEIHRLLWWYARQRRLVVRLKGGDPTVFGRGGEELSYLEERGVPVHIVPGITAAAGVAATLGVPLTHRDFADSVRFVTGHSRAADEPLTAAADAVAVAAREAAAAADAGLQAPRAPAAGGQSAGAAAVEPRARPPPADGGAATAAACAAADGGDGGEAAAARARAERRALARRAGSTDADLARTGPEGGEATSPHPPPQLDLDFAKLACERTTLVVYMGLATLPQLAAGLVAAGLPADIPAVAVQEGTSARQRVVRAPLGALPAAVAAARLRSPTLIVIGHVVGVLTDARVAQSAAEARACGDGASIFGFLTDGLELVGPERRAALRRRALVTPPAPEAPTPARP